MKEKLCGCGRSEDLASSPPPLTRACPPQLGNGRGASASFILGTAVRTRVLPSAAILLCALEKTPNITIKGQYRDNIVTMRASISSSVAIPTLLLLASAAVAQDASTSVSVVTSPFVSPSPTDEQVYTIQTDTTAVASDPWACYQDCFMPPCPPLACKYNHHVHICTASHTDSPRHQ